MNVPFSFSAPFSLPFLDAWVRGVDRAISTKESANFAAIVIGEVTWPISSELFVEAVAYQQGAIEEMERRALAVQAIYPIKNKRARPRAATRYIKSGVVKFHRTGCEQLLAQLLRFGSEKHDDAVEALVYLMLGLVGEGIAPQEIHYV